MPGKSCSKWRSGGLAFDNDPSAALFDTRQVADELDHVTEALLGP